MNKVILDASALLALIKRESRGNIVEQLMSRIVMSSVNVSEAAKSILKAGISQEECKGHIDPFIDEIIP